MYLYCLPGPAAIAAIAEYSGKAPLFGDQSEPLMSKKLAGNSARNTIIACFVSLRVVLVVLILVGGGGGHYNPNKSLVIVLSAF